MNTIRKRTVRIRSEVKKRMSQNPFLHDHIVKLRLNQKKAQDSIMEMWENYLTFTRLDL